MTRKTSKATTSRGGRKSRISLPDECVVNETDQTVPVKEPKRDKPSRQGPTVNAAIDRRKQFSGTDEHARDRR